MRLLSLVLSMILVVSCCSALSDPSNSDNNVSLMSNIGNNNLPHEQLRRSLRWNDAGSGEERKTEKIDDVTEELMQVTEKLMHAAKKLPSNVNIEKLDDNLKKVGDTAKKSKNPAKLTGDGMRKELVLGRDTKVAPVLISKTGRDAQKYEGDRRLLSCVVISNREVPNCDVLLISSSNPKKQDWILPKGGWDKGESIQDAAWREAIEEAGVDVQIMGNLGKHNFQNKDGKKYQFNGFKTEAQVVYNQWPESVRDRRWVSYAEAKTLLAGRKEMLEIVKRAELWDAVNGILKQ